MLLHEQFPTSYAKVGYADLMYNQNQLFRKLGPAPFDVLTQAVAEGPGDADLARHRHRPTRPTPTRTSPGSSWSASRWASAPTARRTSAPAARAFTGWSLDYTTGEFFFNPYDHDNGEKRYLGHTGRFQGEDIIDIATHTEASSSWVVSRFWSWLAYPVTPKDPVVRELAPGYRKDLNIDEPARGHPAPPALRVEHRR